MAKGPTVNQNSSAQGQNSSQIASDKTVDSALSPYLSDILSNAAKLHNAGTGTNLWQGPTQAAFNPVLQSGMDQTVATANQQGGSVAQPFQHAVGQINSNGMTPQLNSQIGSLNSLSDLFKNSASDFSNVASGFFNNAGSSGANLGGIAAGNEVDNPYIAQMLEANNARIANRVNSTMSGAGRYGSGGHTDVLARTMAESNNPVLAQAYESNRNRQLQANQMIDQTRLGFSGLGLNAMQGATGALTGATGATNAATGAVQGAANNALGYAGLAPQLNDLAYDPAKRSLGVGGLVQGQNQAEMDEQRKLFEQQAAMPWTQLGRYLASAGGVAPSFQGYGDTNVQQFGQDTRTGQVQQQTDPGWLDTVTKLGGLFKGGGESAAGTLMALLSDRNEKTDIKKIGTSETTGLGIYAYRYKGDPKSYPKVVGPMAQEIEEKFPGSTSHVDGKLYVKPHATGLLGAL